jgi:oligopeptide/dipeptide ABC transporter ATP-binding protein
MSATFPTHAFVTFDRVTKRFGDKVAVDDVSFAVPLGRTLGIVGESGSGKSTIARLLVGLERPSSGTIAFDGEPFPQRYGAMRPMRQRMAMVFQNPSDALDPHLPIGRVVIEPYLAARRRREATASRAAELLDMVGLGGVSLSRRAGTFSGGEQQRIGFARALALSPELIVCDEPTSSLDVSVQAQVLNVMLELQERTNVGFVLISHDLHVVRRMSHELLVLLDGRVMETGEAEGVCAAPRHPYTRALLDAIPRPLWETETEASISAVHTSTGDTRGCPFVRRCPHAFDACTVMPTLRRASDDDGRHRVACHLTSATKGHT